MALVAHKYMPDQMPEAELRATFAAREHTLEFLVTSLRDQTRAKTLTSYLITGPRGSGKTTIVRMLALRIREDPMLNAKWLPVHFPEELHGVTSLRDLLSATLALLAEDGVPYARERHELVEQEADEAVSRDLAIAGLREIVDRQQKRLILLVENLDLVFERGLDRDDRATLRRLLMVDPFMMVIGTAVSMFDQVRAYDEAFFNYFCPVPLERLDDAKVREILLRRARWDGDEQLVKRLTAEEPKIRALNRLSGGNPRLALMLYEVLGHGNIESVVTTLRQLVDELTPLLKDVLEHQLPAQQSKILDALMRAGGTATPSELARESRLSLNTVTTQLQRLKDTQFVTLQGGGKGNAAYYSIADQLFATWYQMRYLRPHRRRIEMFVEVLRVWFEAGRRLDALMAFADQVSGPGGRDLGSALAAEYFAASLSRTEHETLATDIATAAWLRVGDVREAALARADLTAVLGNDSRRCEAAAYASLAAWAREQGDLRSAVTALREATNHAPGDPAHMLDLGLALMGSDDLPAAFEWFDRAVSASSEPAFLARALVLRCAVRGQQGDLAGAIADATAVIERDGAPADEVAKALLLRSATRGQQGNLAGAIADATAVIERDGAPVDEVAQALVFRGAVRGQHGDLAGAIADAAAVIERDGAPADEVAKALFLRGVARGQHGDLAGAITDWTAVIGHDGAPADVVTKALLIRGAGRGQQRDLAGAITDWTAVIGRDGAPADDVAQALLLRGTALRQQGDVAGAITDSTTVIEGDGSRADEVVRALVFRGRARAQQGEVAEAIVDWTAAINQDGAAADEVNQALLLRGMVRAQQGDMPGAIADATAVIERDSVAADDVAKALLLRSATRGQQGDVAGAIEDCTILLSAVGIPRDDMRSALILRARGYALLTKIGEAIEDLRSLLRDVIGVDEKCRSLVAFLLSRVRREPAHEEEILDLVRGVLLRSAPDQRVQDISGLLRFTLDPGQRAAWPRICRALIADQPAEIADRLRVFEAVADVLEGADLSRLHPLPPEQREFALEILGSVESPTALGVNEVAAKKTRLAQSAVTDRHASRRRRRRR